MNSRARRYSGKWYKLRKFRGAEKPGVMHAYYSAQHDAMSGHAVYARASGKEVKVTEITSRRSANGSSGIIRWQDSVYIGKVVRFVRVGEKRRERYNWLTFYFTPIRYGW